METETQIETESAVKEPPAARRLEYDDSKSNHVTRRQMNLLLLLLFINTLLFAGFLCLPSATPFLKQMWNDWQASRAEKQKAANLQAKLEACMVHALPADKLVYAESAGDVKRLLNEGRALTIDQAEQFRRNIIGGGGGLFGGNQNLQRVVTALENAGWQTPAIRGRPPELVALDSANPTSVLSGVTDDTCLFLHAMKTPAGARRLVWITAAVTQYPAQPREQHAGPDDDRYTFHTVRTLTAHVLDESLAGETSTSIEFTSTPERESSFVIKPDGAADLRLRGQWRIFAAQPDPADPTHLTLKFDIDGQPGTIDGHLQDGDRLMLEPRAGRLTTWKLGSVYIWDLNAPTTTQPVRPP